jgi:hypothetical protein
LVPPEALILPPMNGPMAVVKSSFLEVCKVANEPLATVNNVHVSSGVQVSKAVEELVEQPSHVERIEQGRVQHTHDR